jgi:hypothetical protein
LRHGDPISPYLFIIVADVLQHLIQRASADGSLLHPIDSSLPCPVLQYADDTLIKGDVRAMEVLKRVLEDFSTATGLTINYHKSTFVPMNITEGTAASMAVVLGCAVSSFPQTHLGLPLSPHKIRVADYQPLISKFDKFLASWKARLLSTGVRLVLVNVVLSSLAIYHMSSTLIPKTVLDSWMRAVALSCGLVKKSAMAHNVCWLGTEFVNLKNTGALASDNSLIKITACSSNLCISSLILLCLPWKTWFLK